MEGSVRPRLETLARRVQRNVAQCVRIDTRTLAVFRVFVGLLIIADVLLRARNFTHFYTEEGVVPRSLAMELSADNAFSFYHLTTDPTLIALLMGIQILIAVQLIVGYKTRIATILSFLFVVSLDHHNPLVLSYADTLFRLLLFWAIFLPLGERWSVDAVHAGRDPRPSVAGVASALILCQMVYMYFLNWYHKSENELWTSGEATPLIMGLDDMTFLFVGYARQFPVLLELGSYMWYYMLMFSWLLLVLVGRKRMFLVALFAGGHASFILTVRIGAFPYVAMAGLLLFLQAQFWDDLKAVAALVDFDTDRLTGPRTRLESVAAAVPYPRVTAPSLDQIRTGAYSVTLGVVLGSLVLLSILSYIPAVALIDGNSTPEERVDDVASSFGVDQPNWSVFAPNPRTTDRYYVFPAETADGDRIDVYNDRPLTYERPSEELHTQYDTYRYRFYMNSVRSGGFNDNDVPPILADHLCETWEEEYGVELTHVNMYVVYEDITYDTIDDHENRDTRTSQLYEHGCGDNEPKEIQPPDF
ncbi:HTTM domain-containing protein [Natronorubrum texcoconense]|uniref:Vitamin K-dependent gamma-carboxylase n=1 Tax=Natronorubrum texcoconense TaxID=1095776 RepID=A0A1G9GDG6_9EURY|nr:HTTM domain-containing protein [Natronorubrum texcoconense]SDK98736.1 Vitamin K-dependent gamma-carboxylase [Natronorubrum texcoconense]